MRLSGIVIAPQVAATEWIFSTLEKLAGVTGNVQTKRADRKDEIKDEGDKPLIVLTSYPGAKVIEAIEQGDVPLLILEFPPAEAVGWMMHERNQKFVDAIRPLSESLVANFAARTNRFTRVLTLTSTTGAAEALAMVVSELRWNVDAQSLARLVADNLDQPSATLNDLSKSKRKAKDDKAKKSDDATLSEIEHTILAEAILPLSRAPYADTVDAIRWRPEIFFLGDRPGNSGTETIDVVGGARILLYGPYLHFPAADYWAEFEIAFRGLISDLPFNLELYGKELIASARIGPRPEGYYAGRFEFTIRDPFERIEIRLQSASGSIDGEISFSGLTIHPQLNGT